MCVCVCLGSGFGPSQIPSVLFVTAQHASAAVSGPHHGCRGTAVSVSGASVAQGAV